MLTDYSIGFGGKFGVQTDRQDKSAVGWEHHETLPQHDSQIDHKKASTNVFKYFKYDKRLCINELISREEIHNLRVVQIMVI